MESTTAQPDIVIRNGTIVDGTGRAPYVADIAIRGETIAEIGAVAAKGLREIDAEGLAVTPGFIDLHTHYDGQAIWSSRLNPSSSHGVTTVVIGNCGVGFAPCRVEDQQLLVRVMEGVEDIPGVVMAEGLDWRWTSFPDYLDALEARRRDIDVAAFLPHSPLRIFVMGERGARREAATADDLVEMRRLAREAVSAGALGFATSRVSVHRTADGEAIPSYDAALGEIVEIGRGIAEAGGGLLQLVPDLPKDGWATELGFVRAVARETGCPVTFTFGIGNEGPPIWKHGLAAIAAAREEGLEVTGQVFPRPVGLICSFDLSVNPFSLCSSYAEVADLPPDRKLAELMRPGRKARILSETPSEGHPLAQLGRRYNWMFPLGANADYEPRLEDSVAQQAARAGVSPESWAYEYLLGEGGTAKLLVALGNFPNGSLDDVVSLLTERGIILGLGDGGAHYGMICDASYPTFLLTHLVRDRPGQRIPLPEAIKMLSADPAAVAGLRDRGLLKPGYKADLNVIDLDRLTLLAPQVKHDLPAGGRRLDQESTGFRATIVSGAAIRENDRCTGATPGRLVRGARLRPAPAGTAGQTPEIV